MLSKYIAKSVGFYKNLFMKLEASPSGTDRITKYISISVKY